MAMMNRLTARIKCQLNAKRALTEASAPVRIAKPGARKVSARVGHQLPPHWLASCLISACAILHTITPNLSVASSASEKVSD